MSAPVVPLISPVQAALALRVSHLVKGIGEARVLLWLLAHPWSHTAEEIAEGVPMAAVCVYRIVPILVGDGLIVKTGHVETRRVNKGPFPSLYRAAHAVPLKEVGKC